MATQTFTVTHPDGTVSKRTSKSRAYRFTVVVTSPKVARLAEAHRDEKHWREQAEKYEAAAADGAITETRKPWSFGGQYVSLYVGGEFATSYVEGGEHAKERPSDEALRDGMHERAEHARENEAACAKKAAEIEAGPENVYGAIRWSVSESNARTAATGKEFAFYRERGHSLAVVPVD